MYLGDLWELSRPGKLALSTLFTRSNMARFPEGQFYRILTERSYLVMRKMSRPYEMILRPG